MVSAALKMALNTGGRDVIRASEESPPGAIVL